MFLSPEIERLLTRFDTITDTYLRQEVDEALARREEITPHLLAILKEMADNPVRHALEQHNGHVYAAVLLAYFREPAALAPIIRAFSIPQEELDFLWGDMTTETLPILLHRTGSGSMEQIKQLIADRTVSEFVRGAAVEALTFAVADGDIPREEAVSFLHGLFTGQEAEPGSTFWGLLVGSLCDLHPSDSMAVIRQAHSDGLFDEHFIGLDDIEWRAAQPMTTTLEELRRWKERRVPADIHAYLSWFDEFQPRIGRVPSAAAKGGGKARQTKNKKKANRAKNREAKKTRKKNR